MKIAKIILYSLAGLLALVLVALAAIYGLSGRRLSRLHSVQARTLVIPTTAAAVEKGRHIVSTRGCMDCHGADLGGKKVIDDPAVGMFWGPNLTRGAGGLPADHTDLDFVRAIRHGVAPNGRSLVLMPSQEYTTLSDEDLGATIAYLKSVPPVDRPRGPVAPGPVARLLIVMGQIKLAADEINHETVQAASVTPEISVSYGKYLIANCVGCHGPNLSGGKIPGGPPHWPAAANLTPEASTRISKWTEAQFVSVLRTHQRPDGTQLDPVMPAAYAQMTDVELKALWAYLKSIPPAATASR
jgi:mono/diheme cytochrome c family protein